MVNVVLVKNHLLAKDLEDSDEEKPADELAIDAAKEKREKEKKNYETKIKAIMQTFNRLFINCQMFYSR